VREVSGDTRRFRRRTHVRLADDLQQRHTGPVEVDEARVSVRVVNVLARILFHMDPGETDGLAVALFSEDLDLATDAQRQLILRDLVPLRKVGIKVVLARPAAVTGDATVDGQAGPDRKLHHAPIEYRQHPGMPRQSGQVFSFGVPRTLPSRHRKSSRP